MPGMRMGLRQGTWLAWLLAALTAWFLWESLGLSPVASLIPRFVLCLTLLLLLVEIAVATKADWVAGSDFTSKAAQPEALPVIPEGAVKESATVPGQTWRVLMWIALLPLAFWSLGVTMGAVVFCLVFLKWRSRESWLFSISVSAVLGVVLQVLFSWVFQAGLYRGIWTY